ncbi:hypothetical protein T07_9190 [Trichinella nelsoni]|uniref:Uncharacterized protein n=1 Tax=Trichinella nelsoni TaxID=6336 RepID=A0A0V0RTH2_9BILA|nr:hypothetical protein T07_9190 [Trichinella nelsoni]
MTVEIVSLNSIYEKEYVYICYTSLLVIAVQCTLVNLQQTTLYNQLTSACFSLFVTQSMQRSLT